MQWKFKMEKKCAYGNLSKTKKALFEGSRRFLNDGALILRNASKEHDP